MRRAFRSTTARMAIAGVIALTALGALAYAGAQPRSLETSPEEFLESIGLEVEDLQEGGEENGNTEDGFDPAPLREGSVASEHASQTAIDVLTVIEAWQNGEFDSGCEFGQAVAAAARDDDEENGENGDEAFDPCEREGSNGEEASAAGRAKGEEMSAAGKAKGQAAAEAGKAKGAEAAGAARGRGAPGGGASNGGGGGGSGPPSDPGPPPGAGPPGGTPGGP